MNLSSIFVGIFSKLYFEFIQNGWMRSFIFKECKDKKGNPLPLFSYPAIEYIETLDMSKLKILEIGSGYSTIYFSKRAKKVLSFECDPKWLKKVNNKIKQLNLEKKVNLKYVDIPKPFNHSSPSFRKKTTEVYLQTIKKVLGSQENKFDLIVIDGWGYHRLTLSKFIFNYLSDQGILILDDSDELPKTEKFLNDLGLIQVPFKGYSPGGVRHVTSVFFNKKMNIPTLKRDMKISSMFAKRIKRTWIEE